VPLIVTALCLLTRPASAFYLSKKGWGSHLLTAESIRKIRTLGGHSATTVGA